MAASYMLSQFLSTSLYLILALFPQGSTIKLSDPLLWTATGRGAVPEDIICHNLSWEDIYLQSGIEGQSPTEYSSLIKSIPEPH